MMSKIRLFGLIFEVVETKNLSTTNYSITSDFQGLLQVNKTYQSGKMEENKFAKSLFI